MVYLTEMRKSLRPSEKLNYCVPLLWVPDWYDGSVKVSGGKAFVDPGEFFGKIIEWILARSDKSVDYNQSICLQRNEISRDWIKGATIYGALIRSTAAYNHKGFGRFEQDDVLGYRESGTFLKMIALLPFLKKFRIDALYLLPVTRSSNVFKKGELGSPYAVKDFMEIDDIYHDPLLSDWKVEDEFAALVEASHILGIRILTDFIPRTAARDSNLILQHPEWFYWIRVEDLYEYAPPRIDDLEFKIPEYHEMRAIYDYPSVIKHLKRFEFDPKTSDQRKWNEFVKKVNDSDFISDLVRFFGLITAPGFSDWINDPQPTWDDITFLRLYEDHPVTSAGKVQPNQPPYILFDVIKASKFPGERPNIDLWNYISSILPEYQKRYGIDGVRLDMGHALPADLEHLIMKEARDIDPGFVFMAEEFDFSRAEHAKKAGYDAIIGNSWCSLPRPEKAYEFYQNVATSTALPFIAAAETADTPRIASRRNGEILRYLVPYMCAFAPSGIFFINSGQEVAERQPMNLGLDNSFQGRFMLNAEDEFQGKLAFFDHYALHWEDGQDMVRFLCDLSHLRSQYRSLICNGTYRPVYFDWQDGKTANASFWSEQEGIIFVANLDLDSSRRVKIELDKTIGKVEGIVRRFCSGSWKTLGLLEVIDVEIEPGATALFHITRLEASS